jgi:hypothetical protein
MRIEGKAQPAVAECNAGASSSSSCCALMAMAIFAMATPALSLQPSLPLHNLMLHPCFSTTFRLKARPGTGIFCVLQQQQQQQRKEHHDRYQKKILHSFAIHKLGLSLHFFSFQNAEFYFLLVGKIGAGRISVVSQRLLYC